MRLNRWAIAHRKSLEQNAPDRLQAMKDAGMLDAYLEETGDRAERQYEEIVAHLTAEARKDKALAEDFIGRHQRLMGIASQAEELVMLELLVEETNRRKERRNSSDDHADKFIDSGEGITLNDSSCWSCARKHLNAPTCDAFPRRIPNPILDGEHDHTTPYPGDHGLLYLPENA